MTDRRDTSEAGLSMIDTVYGAGFREHFTGPAEPYLDDSVDHLFGAIWSRPGLSIRDRRLLSMGAIAALGRGDLFSIHALGALRSGDLDADELHEIVLHLAYYAGSPNGTVIRRGVLDALAAYQG